MYLRFYIYFLCFFFSSSFVNQKLEFNSSNTDKYFLHISRRDIKRTFYQCFYSRSLYFSVNHPIWSLLATGLSPRTYCTFYAILDTLEKYNAIHIDLKNRKNKLHGKVLTLYTNSLILTDKNQTKPEQIEPKPRNNEVWYSKFICISCCCCCCCSCCFL